MAKNASSKRIIHGFQQLLRSNPTASPASSTIRETLLESDSIGGQRGVLSRLLAARRASLAAGTRSPAISPPGLLNPRRLVAESGAKLPLLGSGARGTGQANGSGLRHRLLHTCTNNCSSAILPSLDGRFAVKLPPLGFGIKGLGRINGSEVRRRLYSAKSAWHGKYGGELGKSVVGKPVSAVKSAVSRYREAVGLQIEAFWKRNYMALVAAGAVFVCIALWRVMFSVASTFVGLSEGMAKYGFLALASAMVAFAGMYLRARFTIYPDKVYRMAMTKLNMSPAILEVMGAPLTGTDVRAYVMSGGGPKLKDFKFRLGGKRCFLIFPIRGSERRGLVSVEVKKKKGQNDMKLLAVDIPMLTGPDQRLYLVGDEQEYKVGGGLISELRDPIVKAMAAEKEFDDLDEKEEEEDELREREEAERRQREEEAEALRREEERLHEKEEERNRQEAKNLEKTGS